MIQDYKTLLISSEAPVLRIYLNRPEKRNALNKTLISELSNLMIKASKSDSVKIVRISGEGSAFCSGADLDYLKELQKYDHDKNREDIDQLADLYQQINNLPKPVIAAVNGPAVAGGCGLATVCDIIIASDKARFGYPETSIGFVAAVVSLYLIRQIGERRAKELLLTGKIINASEAYEIGLVNKVVKHEILDEKVKELETQLLKNSPDALRQTKELFSVFEYIQVSELISKYKKANLMARESNDFLEGITAFLEKRKPKWN